MTTNLKQLLGGVRLFTYLRLTPFESLTESGRTTERYRLALLTIVVTIFYRMIGMTVLLVSFPLTLTYLGKERFGLWMTVASFSGVLSFLDFGIGNAMVAEVANISASGDAKALRRLISSGLAMLFGIGIVIAGFLFAIVQFLPLDIVFKNLANNFLDEARDALNLFVFLFALSIPAQAIQRIFAGLQKTYIANSVMACGSLLSLVLIYLASERQASIVILLDATFGVQVLTPIVLLAMLWRRNQFSFIDAIAVQHDKSRGLIRLGGLYFVLQIGTIVGWGVDNILVASTLGVAAVSILVVVQRLFDFVLQPLAILNAPLWGAYAHAHAQMDVRFIRVTLKRSMFFTSVFATLGVGTIFLGKNLIFRYWMGENFAVPLNLVLVYGAWSLIAALGNAFAMYMNGRSIVTPQVLVTIAFVICSLTMKLNLVEGYGLVGIPIATIIAYIICVILPYSTIFRKEILTI